MEVLPFVAGTSRWSSTENETNQRLARREMVAERMRAVRCSTRRASFRVDSWVRTLPSRGNVTWCRSGPTRIAPVVNRQVSGARPRFLKRGNPTLAPFRRPLGERAETRPVRGIGQSGTALRRIPPAVVVGGGGRARAGGPAGRGSPAASPPGNPRYVL